MFIFGGSMSSSLKSECELRFLKNHEFHTNSAWILPSFQWDIPVQPTGLKPSQQRGESLWENWRGPFFQGCSWTVPSFRDSQDTLKWLLSCPKNPWDVGRGVKNPPCFEAPGVSTVLRVGNFKVWWTMGPQLIVYHPLGSLHRQRWLLFCCFSPWAKSCYDFIMKRWLLLIPIHLSYL